ncbi:RNA polymerase-associated protein LEO1-like [Helianthus annuus]|uniref:RNA polymerase-associated protein LEO1-like n=1 Tax=Helianthus annuus TaxID=4232 RepID=UPI000B8F08CC|nr:RNA polymerase-associated protein LEO1-like [Helianthus annuus]
MRIKKLESENKSLLKKIDTDQTEIDFLKVRVAELVEEKAHRDEQNKYFELKNKELEAAKALKEHEFYMLNKVVENMLGTSIEQKFEEIQVEELRAKHQAEIDAQMKDKGKGVESSVAVAESSIVPSLVIENPVPISSVSAIFEENVSLEDLAGDDDEEDDEEDDDEGDDDEEDDDDDEKVFSASSHGSDDDNDDDDQGGMGIKVTEPSSEKTVDDYLNDSVNEETEGADGKGEHGDDQNVEQVEKLILRIEPHLEEEYEYKYVEDADLYDRVEFEDCTDDESVNEDTSQFPTLMEFFTEENRDELRRKVAEILKDKNFDGTPKDMQKEERQKWFKDSHERKFKRPLKYYQRNRSISLGDIISWGFLPHVNAYAIRIECGVQYFDRLYVVMSLPWWDVEELSKPHYPKRVTRVDPVTGVEETILNVKKPKTMKNIPVPKMEQDFYKGFLGWSKDREQAMQFQQVVSICFQKGINSENKWNSKWRSLEEKERKKAERERKKLDENRGKWMKQQDEEAKKAKKENERVRNLLRRKPKSREETFKSL